MAERCLAFAVPADVWDIITRRFDPVTIQRFQLTCTRFRQLSFRVSRGAAGAMREYHRRQPPLHSLGASAFFAPIFRDLGLDSDTSLGYHDELRVTTPAALRRAFRTHLAGAADPLALPSLALCITHAVDPGSLAAALRLLSTVSSLDLSVTVPSFNALSVLASPSPFRNIARLSVTMHEACAAPKTLASLPLTDLEVWCRAYFRTQLDLSPLTRLRVLRLRDQQIQFNSVILSLPRSSALTSIDIGDWHSHCADFSAIANLYNLLSFTCRSYWSAPSGSAATPSPERLRSLVPASCFHSLSSLSISAAEIPWLEDAPFLSSLLSLTLFASPFFAVERFVSHVAPSLRSLHALFLPLSGSRFPLSCLSFMPQLSVLSLPGSVSSEDILTLARATSLTSLTLPLSSSCPSLRPLFRLTSIGFVPRLLDDAFQIAPAALFAELQTLTQLSSLLLGDLLPATQDELRQLAASLPRLSLVAVHTHKSVPDFFLRSFRCVRCLPPLIT